MMGHPWRSGITLGAVIGALVASGMLYVAWDHNPQGEFHGELGVNWANWLFLGFSWFVPVSLVSSLISGTIISILNRRRGAA